MIYVKRANVVLEVDEDSAQFYLDKGYDIIDEAGNVIQKAIPSDLGTLRKFYVDASATIDGLKSKIKALEAEIVELKKQPKSEKKKQKAEK